MEEAEIVRVVIGSVSGKLTPPRKPVIARVPSRIESQAIRSIMAQARAPCRRALNDFPTLRFFLRCSKVMDLTHKPFPTEPRKRRSQLQNFGEQDSFGQKISRRRTRASAVQPLDYSRAVESKQGGRLARPVVKTDEN